MKKKVSLLVLLFLLFMPLIAKADMGAPIVRTYEAIVIKVDGVDYYEQGNDWEFIKKGHLDKDAKISIEFEINEDNEVYLAFPKDGDYYYVKAGDVSPLEEEVKPDGEDISRLDSKQTIKIEAKGGVEVKKGPSVAYETIGTLKRGVEATYRYEIDESGYIYVDAGEIKGWILTLEGAVLFSGGDYILADEIEVTCGKLPANTILKDTWYTDMWTGNINIEYKDCKSFYHWFKEPAFVSYGPKVTGKASKEITIYEKPDMKKKVGTIAKDSKVNVYSEKYFADEYDPDVKPLVYVEVEGKKGWIVDDEKTLYDVEELKEEVPEEEEEQEEEKPKEKKEKKEDSDEETSKMDTKTIVIVCVVGAAAFALGAIATIILVNRKNKKKKNQEEVVPATEETTVDATDEKKE